MCDIPIPKKFLECRQQILNGFAGRPPQSYEPSKWQTYFKDDNDFKEISCEFPKTIGRKDLEFLSQSVAKGDFKRVRKLFLACMIWGYIEDSRGPWRTKQMLSSTKTQELLENSARLISEGNIIEAYKHFKLPWCRSAFFTKFFYFVGLGTVVKPLPLILDSRVVKALIEISKEDEWDISRFVKLYKHKNGELSIRKYPEGYVQYIHCMGKWAGELGCRADNIEYYLFKLTKSSNKTKHNYRCR